MGFYLFLLCKHILLRQRGLLPLIWILPMLAGHCAWAWGGHGRACLPPSAKGALGSGSDLTPLISDPPLQDILGAEGKQREQVSG